jgi:3-hydroxyacyl-CoA dehydrogenase
MALQTLGVVGAGQMGNGIAQVAAYPGGVEVIMNDIADQFVDRGYDTISKNLDRLVAKEKLTTDQKKDNAEHLVPGVWRIRKRFSETSISRHGLVARLK